MQLKNISLVRTIDRKVNVVRQIEIQREGKKGSLTDRKISRKIDKNK